MSVYEVHANITVNGTYEPISPILSKVGDFTIFYITITICSVLLGFLLILNIACCCSKYSEYWLDRHTGNRWIVSIWSNTPYKQPPLDITELESQFQPVEYLLPYSLAEGIENHGHESFVPSVSQQPLTLSNEYLNLYKRQSDL